MKDVRIHEASPFGLTTPVAGGKPGRFRVQLITPGWGSSGYYSEALLKKAAKDRVFASGTQMYVDHPTESEKWERPERSIRDLGAVLVTDPAWDPDAKALVAEAQVFSPFASSLAEMRDAIGVSIRARGTFEPGEAEGRHGNIITALTEGDSVDFVTNAGRGGRIIDVLESMRPSRVIERATEHGVAEATANDIRDALQSAVHDRFGTDDDDSPWTWVRDFDDSTVWYQVNDATYELGYSLNDDGSAALDDGDPTEVTARTTYVPVGSAGGSTTTEESEEGTVGNISIDEAEHRRLTEAAQRAAEAETRATEAERRAVAAEGTIAENNARADATARATALVGEAELRQVTRDRIVASVTTGLPMRDGQLDVAAFESRVRERITSEATFEASLLAEAGVGQVRGEGGRPAPAGEPGELDEAAIEAALEREFGAMGLSESHAKTAAAGRG